ncbi:hypothetical protein BDR07DRAFT_1395571, partial [Suillus spraguei]
YKINYVCVGGKEKKSSNPPASPTEARNSPTTGSLSSTSESDTNEPSSVHSDPSSLSTVSRLDSSTDSDTESESAGLNPDGLPHVLVFGCHLLKRAEGTVAWMPGQVYLCN